MAYQIYVLPTLVGEPDPRTRHWQFIPFDPFLPAGMLWGVLPHKFFLCGLTLREKCNESCLTYGSSRSIMSLKVPGREGACTDMAERQPIPIPEPQPPPHEGGNGAPGLPRTVHESANPPPPESRSYSTLQLKSVLNRAVNRTRELYERNGWTFLPWGEAGKGSPSVPTLQGEQASHGEGSNGAELTSEQIRKANEEFFKELGRLLDSPPLSEEFHQRVRERFRRLPQKPKPHVQGVVAQRDDF
jgi:hypothetical protein